MTLPINIDFTSWANSLVVDFPKENIPLYREDDDWRLFGNVIAELTSFANNGTPGTENFEEPMAWAMAVFKQMANVA